MKKYKFIVSTIIIILLLFGNKVYASNENNSRKLVYQDVTVNEDGSVTVKEATWLNGNYNGLEKNINIKLKNSYPFTGIYGNFSGDSDIYNATEVSDIKVFDISQSRFNSIDDINNTEKEFERVEKASKGKYGVYTVTKNSYYYNIQIYCPYKKQKVFYTEYTIKNVVVVHNDVAELYRSFLKNDSSDVILDYKLRVHLPQEDSNVMIWAHGQPTTSCSIIDYKTLFLQDTNIATNKFETLRIMFDKSLVPQAEKKSNVNGKEYILKYENAMANPELEEKQKIDIENRLSKIILELDEAPYISSYNSAKNLLSKLTWDDELKKEYQEKLNNLKEIVNQKWKESVERKYNDILEDNFIHQGSIDSLIMEINEGFDKEAKEKYYAQVSELQEIKNQKTLEAKHKILQIVAIGYCILGIICIEKLIKSVWEKNNYNKKYYREIPSDDKAYVIDYLMNKKITTKTLMLTILELISEKKIILEKNPDVKDDFIFVLSEEEFSNTVVEKTVIGILFNVVGKNNRCSMNELKNYGIDASKANTLIRQFEKFEKNVKDEIKQKKYFKKKNRFNKLLKVVDVVFGLISIILGFFVSGNGYISVWIYYLMIISLSIIYYKILVLDKGRTIKGSIEYSKWLAHKRFLEDFGKLEKMDLPEITLWDKYLVTAATLGCLNQVLNKMEFKMVNYEAREKIQAIMFQYMQYQNIKKIENAVDSLINNARTNSTIGSSSSSGGGSSYSSGSGHGGGASSGGMGGGGDTSRRF